MGETIRVNNMRKFCVGIKLQNGIEYNIVPKGFVTLTRDDVDYLGSIAPSLFKDEIVLMLGDREVSVENGFIENMDNVPLGTEGIRKNLGQAEKKLRVWLDEITEPYLLDEVYAVAMTMDLTAAKLKTLAEKMPDKDFLNLVGNGGQNA